MRGTAMPPRVAITPTASQSGFLSDAERYVNNASHVRMYVVMAGSVVR